MAAGRVLTLPNPSCFSAQFPAPPIAYTPPLPVPPRAPTYSIAPQTPKMEAKMMSIPVRRVITRFAVLTSICGRVMTLPDAAPTVHTPLPAEEQGIRKDEEVPPETRQVTLK